MFVNTELLEFIRLKNPLSSVIGKYHIAADSVLREYSSELTKEYLLGLKYSKEEPDTAPLEAIMQMKYGISKEFWNAAPEHIMEYLTAERNHNE